MKAHRLDYNFPDGRCELRMQYEQEGHVLHCHSFDEIVFVLKGSGVHVVGNDQYPLIRGDVFVMRDSHAHMFNHPKHLTLANIIYQRDFFHELKKEFADSKGFKTLFETEPRSIGLVKISSAIDYMEKNYPEEISVNHLANKADMASSTFRRIFKQTTGLTPTDFLIHLRIEKAAKMILQKNVKITDASLASGFWNSSYFTRKFK